MKKLITLTIVSVLVTFAAMLSGGNALGAGGIAVYDSTVTPLPGNLPSVGPEAYAFKQLGDRVTFAGTNRNLSTVTVTLSSWGCQTGRWYTNDCVTAPGATFAIPITLNIYNAGSGNTVGSLITTQTRTFTVPYRPSADNVRCTGANLGKWYQASTATCFNGRAANISFDFIPGSIVLPNTVVYGVSYNTTSAGPVPIGAAAPCFSSSGGCPYDSLNIALAPSVTVGSKPFPNTLYQDTAYAPNYCDSGLDGVGTFRLDSATNACWMGYVPAIQFRAFGAGNNQQGGNQGGNNQQGGNQGGNNHQGSNQGGNNQHGANQP